MVGVVDAFGILLLPDGGCTLLFGQLLALAAILIVMGFWRRTDSFWRHAYSANTVMMTLVFVLIGYHLTGYIVS